MEVVQAQHDRTTRIAQLKASIRASSQRLNMSSEVTLGFENLGIEKKPGSGRYARKRARKLAELEQQSKAQTAQTTPQEVQLCPPVVPSYRRLPISPLGSSTTDSSKTHGSGFPPFANQGPPNIFDRRPPPKYVYGHNLQTIPQDQPPQGSAPVNASSTFGGLPKQHLFKVKNTVRTPNNAKPSPGLATQRSPSSVANYYGYPSYRIDKQYRSPQAQSFHDAAAVYPTQYSHSAQYGYPAHFGHFTQSQHPAQVGSWIGSPQRNTQPVISAPPIRSITTKSTSTRAPPPPKPFVKDQLIQVPAPVPTPTYMTLAHAQPTLRSSPQRLLLVLDLNGTLLFRPHAYKNFTSRPRLKSFLSYAFANHSLLIWSSAKPTNVQGMCEKLFTKPQRQRLLGEWGRDTLDLTADQYKSRVQVYKRLDKIWNNHFLQLSHPALSQGERWGQHNTLLIDDSMLKASAQPYNHVEVPEFIKPFGGEKKKGEEIGEEILAQVIGYLEEARKWSDVSAFVRERKFRVNTGWQWDWRNKMKKGDVGDLVTDDDDGTNADDDDGGVKL